MAAEKPQVNLKGDAMKVFVWTLIAMLISSAVSIAVIGELSDKGPDWRQALAEHEKFVEKFNSGSEIKDYPYRCWVYILKSKQIAIRVLTSDSAEYASISRDVLDEVGRWAKSKKLKLVPYDKSASSFTAAFMIRIAEDGRGDRFPESEFLINRETVYALERKISGSISAWLYGDYGQIRKKESRHLAMRN